MKSTLLLATLLCTSINSTPEYGDVYENVSSFKHSCVCYNVKFPNKVQQNFLYFADAESYAKKKKYKYLQYRDCGEHYPYRTYKIKLRK